jgi:hypothetical protein
MGKARLASISSLFGILLIAIGIALVFFPHATISAQDDEGEEVEEEQAEEDVEAAEEREYVGARECRSCHGGLGRDFQLSAHSLTLQDAEDEDVTLLADFSAGEDIRTVQFPDGESRPFTANDVAFALGSGRHIQRYLYAVEDNVYMVFPAEWNTVTGAWQTYDAGDAWLTPAYDFNQNCVYCHVTALNQEEFEWEEDGVQCEACHGPGSEHVDLMDELEFILNEEDREELHASINIAVDPQTCGQCHARGISDTAHPYPNGYLPGEDLSAAFTLVAEDAEGHWYPTGQAAMPNMQYNEWLKSGHASSYETATSSEGYELECLTCHSSGYRRALRILETSEEEPEALPIPAVEAERLPFGVTCSTCHNPHDENLPDSGEDDDSDDESEDEGDEEDEADNGSDEGFDHRTASYEECTACHQAAGEIAGLHYPVKEVYEGLPLIEEVEPVVGAHFSAAEGPICTTCHMPVAQVEMGGTRNSHVLDTVSPAMAVDIEGVQDSCTTCHETVAGQSMQGLIDAVQAKTTERHEAALATVSDDTPQWVADSLLIVANEGSWGIHNTAYTEALLNAAETELGLRESGTAPLVLPQIPTQTAPTEIPEEAVSTSPEPVIGNLTLPSLILLGIALGIIAFAGFAFFRGGNAR